MSNIPVDDLKSTATSHQLNTSSSDHQQIDLTTFTQLEKKSCQKNSQNRIIDSCDYSHRLATGLKYYEKMCRNKANKNISTNTKVLFNQFCTQIYPNFLDDFHHFMKQHGSSEQLLQIADELTNNYKLSICDLSQCNNMRRHYRQREENEKITESNNDDDSEDIMRFVFFTDLYDRAHHYIFHLFKMGLRLEPTIMKDNNDENEDIIDYSCYDALFEKTRDQVKTRRTKCGLNVDRYTDEHNKYNLKIDNHNSNAHSDESKTDQTFLDSLYKQLNAYLTENQFSRFAKYIYENEYDTDSVKEDLHDFDSFRTTQSNIYNDINNVICIDMAKKMIVSGNAFSTGFIFEYNGSVSYYKSLEEEILESGFVNYTQWKEEILHKASEYHQTKTCRNTIKAGYYNQPGFQYGDLISLSHIICVVLYCDWSDLCTHFGATFRRKHAFESFEELKSRHSKYYHFGKRLVETVLNFGIAGASWGWEYSCESGPFYTGLSSVMNVAQFSIYLKGPCSTSKDTEIAINFAKRNGMIIELQNDIYPAGKCQKFFDCSWISNFSEENERLFIAGTVGLRMSTIKIINTAQNFKKIIRALGYFDQMISPNETWSKHIIPSSVMTILTRLINHKLNFATKLKCKEESVQPIDAYILNTFDAFLYEKKQININMKHLEDSFKILSPLVMHNIKDEGVYGPKNKTRAVDNYSREIDHTIAGNLVNVLNTRILAIFPNLNTVTIWVKHHHGRGEFPVYRFNLSSFLSAIEAVQSSIKYIIKAEWRYGPIEEQTWLNDVVSNDIKQKFNDKKWNMQISKGTKGYEEDVVTISKLI